MSHPPTSLPQLLQPEERVLSTLNEDGSRRWLSPRLSKGVWLERRRWVAYGLIAIFTLIPYLKMNGKPLILLDVVKKEFTFFGSTFLPTDTLLLALLILGTLLSIFLITALFGRVWCGWACPQTVYMEFLYRPLERLFLGTSGKGGPAARNVSGVRRAGMYAAYLVVSCYLAHTFLAYFVGVEALSQWVRQSPFEHPTPFAVMMIVTGLMMFDFCYFREQTCILACPYGRLQSVLLDRNSLIVTYDKGRGEPRGRVRSEKGEGRIEERRSDSVLTSDFALRNSNFAGGTEVRGEKGEGRSEERRSDSAPTSDFALRNSNFARGDCIDCHLCVTTCPTGIDIRDGLQLECVNCTQCIDACDAVMDKIGKPRGLIRYSSQNAIAGQKSGLLRWRVVLYPTILLIVASVFFVAVARRQPVDIRILRSTGAPFTVLPDGRVANPMKLKLTNRSDQPQRYHISPAGGAPLEIQLDQGDLLVTVGHAETRGMLIVAPPELFREGRADVKLEIRAESGFATEVDCRLLGPR
jgi:polyferredoxin